MSGYHELSCIQWEILCTNQVAPTIWTDDLHTLGKLLLVVRILRVDGCFLAVRDSQDKDGPLQRIYFFGQDSAVTILQTSQQKTA